MCQFFLGFLLGSFVFLTVFLVFCGCAWGKSICSCQRIEEPEPGPGFFSFPTSLGRFAVDDLFGSPPGILATQLDNVILGQQFSDQKPGDFHMDVFSHVWWHFSSSLKKSSYTTPHRLQTSPRFSGAQNCKHPNLLHLLTGKKRQRPLTLIDMPTGMGGGATGMGWRWEGCPSNVFVGYSFSHHKDSLWMSKSLLFWGYAVFLFANPHFSQSLGP